MYYASPLTLAANGVVVAAGLGLATGTAAVIATFYYIRSHSNPIDLGNDSSFRVSVYNAIWNLL